MGTLQGYSTNRILEDTLVKIYMFICILKVKRGGKKAIKMEDANCPDNSDKITKNNAATVEQELIDISEGKETDNHKERDVQEIENVSKSEPLNSFDTANVECPLKITQSDTAEEQIKMIVNNATEVINTTSQKTNFLTEIDPTLLNSNKNGSPITIKSQEESQHLNASNLKKKGMGEIENIKPKTVFEKRDKHLSAMRLGSKKSGRFWKMERDRFRSTVQSKGLKQLSTQKRIAKKEQFLRVREYEKSLKEDVKRLRKEKIERTEENKKRKAENERKNEIVQVIKNPAKIKRMKKKQLRMLAKRDTTTIV